MSRKRTKLRPAPAREGRLPGPARERLLPASSWFAPPQIWLVLAALAIFLLFSLPQALRVPFHADDLVFLEKTRKASFFDLWAFRNFTFGYYRPWSRELCFWAFQRMFGLRELPFHLAAFGLCLTSLGLYFALARRLIGGAAAAFAVAAVATLAAWGGILMWVSGIQDLWMLAFALGCLVLVSLGRMGWATLLLALALLSKEAAVVIPAVALAYCVFIDGDAPLLALRRTAPLWALAMVWAAFHPLLGGRWWHPTPHATLPWAHPSTASVALRTIGSLASLEELPNPQAGWSGVLLTAALEAVPLVLLLLAFRRPADRSARSIPPPARAVALFGASWMMIGWLPLLQPSIVWHNYYALFGAFGAWLVVARGLSTRRWLAASMVVGLVLLRASRVSTPSTDFGTEFYQTRAANFSLLSRSWFMAHHPSFPPHSHIYLAAVPGGVGFVPGDERSILMQLWYGDTTLVTSYVSRYQPPAPSAGHDYLFRYDHKLGWQEEPILGLPPDPTPEERDAYASSLWNLHRYSEAQSQYRLLAESHPERWDYIHNAGACALQAGDTVTAAIWFERAARNPNASPGVKGAGRHFARYLPH